MKKRKLGDRPDGVKIRKIDSMHYIYPLLNRNRCDNEAYMRISVDISGTEKFIREFNMAHPDNRLTMFSLVVAATLKLVQKRPQLNRFITNDNLYQRNRINAAFTVKKDFRDDGDETLARINMEDGDTLESLSRKVAEQISQCKTQDDESTEAMDAIMKIPGKSVVGAIARFLDRHGWMPESVIATDPYQCSVVLTNFGSIGLDIGYHHLMNWGTNSLFVIMGSKKNRSHLNPDGSVTTTREIDLAFTVDERISDGFYYARSMKLLKSMIEHPELIDG